MQTVGHLPGLPCHLGRGHSLTCDIVSLGALLRCMGPTTRGAGHGCFALSDVDLMVRIGGNTPNETVIWLIPPTLKNSSSDAVQ